MVYTESFLIALSKTIKEVHLLENEWEVLERVDLFRDDDDMANLGRIQNQLTEIYNKVKKSYLNAEQARNMTRDKVFIPFHDLVLRLTETKKFPELYALWNMCQ